MIKLAISCRSNVFHEIVNSIYASQTSITFREYLEEEGFEFLLEFIPPCTKSEYYDFVKENTIPTSCTEMDIYKFQSEILHIIFDFPRIAERIEIEYCLKTNK